MFYVLKNSGERILQKAEFVCNKVSLNRWDPGHHEKGLNKSVKSQELL